MPSGVKFDAVKSRFTGVPTKAGTFTATINVKNASKSTSSVQIAIDVKPLDSWAQGTFNGASHDDGAPLGLVQSLVVSAAGKVSGKLLENGLAWTLTAPSYSSYDKDRDVYAVSVVAKSGKLAVTNEMEVSEGDVDGSSRGVASGDGITALQNLWKTEPWKTTAKPFANKSLVLSGTADGLPNDGDSVTLKFAASGTVSASGKFVTGFNEKTKKDIVYSASCSSVLIPAGEGHYSVFVYFPLKPGRFDGYAAEVQLVWTGAAFEMQE